MHLIVYTSETTLADEQIGNALTDIVATATRNNVADGITGVIFFENRHFLQAIEGEEPKLRRLFDKISNDPRHHNIFKLVDQPTVSRTFPDWTMDTFYVDAPELVDTETIKLIYKLYDHNFQPVAKDVIDFIKQLIDEIDTFKILKCPN